MTDSRVPAVADEQIASAWLRLGGFLVDSVILLMIGVLLARVLDIDLDAAGALELPPRLRLAQGIAGAIYYIWFTSSRGQTPGKMIAGTKVVMERTAEIPDLRPAMIRWALPGFFTFLPGISVIRLAIYAWVPFDERRRGLHDRAAQTVVIKAR